MLSFKEWLDKQPPPVKLPDSKQMKMNTSDLIKGTEKAGTKISKEKLIEALRKSTQKEFSFSQSQNSKMVVVVLPIQLSTLLKL